MIFSAEIGLNYESNVDLAAEMILQSRKAGADIAKFQLGWRGAPGEINHLKPEDLAKLKSWADYCGIELMVSIFTEEAWVMAQDFGFPRYKIASRTVIDQPKLCEAILGAGKETFVSLGMWSKKEFPFGKPNEKLRYVYCQSKYPTEPKDFKTFPERFSSEGYFGYSDHFLGIEGCLMAVARGARYVEKHFTLSKVSKTIRDHILSATPDEFATLTSVGHDLAKLREHIET